MLHNNGWGKSRNQVLNRQESSASHNQCKQSSVLHNRDKGKLCVTKGPGEEPEPDFEQAGKLCATQSVQVKLCVTYEALCSTIGTRGSSVSQKGRGKGGGCFEQTGRKTFRAVAASK